MDRIAGSHKGENGKIAVIGGSRHIHGAPLFSALAAEAAGVDLIFICTSDYHENVAKEASFNFQVHPFADTELTTADVGNCLEQLATMDSAVIGPGLHHGDDTLKAMKQMITASSCPLVLDATALQKETLSMLSGKTAVLTPHLGELERMDIDPKNIGEAAQKAGVIIVLKGETDRIAGTDGTVTEIKGGNAGLTVGGTGDALAGLIAGLIALRMEPRVAAETACTVIKRAAAVLYPDKGYAFTTRDIIAQIPHLLHTL